MPDDPRDAAARYRLDQERARHPELRDDAPDPPAPRAMTAWERQAYVETAIAQAIRRGEFDDLPGAGKPIEGLGDHHDPDWWIRRKIQTEKLTGLGPPALTLRVEHARMSETLDALGREDDVRDALEDFNRRVIEARRQLLGGPPVVTPTRDVDAEIAAWHDRRRERADAAAADAARAEASTPERRRRFGRRR